MNIPVQLDRKIAYLEFSAPQEQSDLIWFEPDRVLSIPKTKTPSLIVSEPENLWHLDSLGHAKEKADASFSRSFGYWN